MRFEAAQYEQLLRQLLRSAYELKKSDKDIEQFLARSVRNCYKMARFWDAENESEDSDDEAGGAGVARGIVDRLRELNAQLAAEFGRKKEPEVSYSPKTFSLSRYLSSGGGSSVVHRKNPQPGAARRYLAQAEHDINAAANDVSVCADVRSVQWACYKLHQVQSNRSHHYAYLTLNSCRVWKRC